MPTKLKNITIFDDQTLSDRLAFHKCMNAPRKRIQNYALWRNVNITFNKRIPTAKSSVW